MIMQVRHGWLERFFFFFCKDLTTIEPSCLRWIRKAISVLKCKFGTMDESFKATFVYGHPESQNKYKNWDLLKGQKPRDDVA